MHAIQPRDNEGRQATVDPLELFPVTPLIQGNDLPTLIIDFFDWLETVWQLPIFMPDAVRPSLPPPFMLADGLYTITDLMRLSEYSFAGIDYFLTQHGIFPSESVCLAGTRRQSRAYKKQDLAPFLAQWEWKRLTHVLDQWWLRFFPPACGTCGRCQESTCPQLPPQLLCGRHVALTRLRSVFTHFLKEVQRLGHVTAWWHEHRTDTWGKTTHSAVGILVIYLLDRRLLHLSNDELIQFSPLYDKSHQDLIRLWRNRRPAEYAQFLQAMNAASYRNIEVQKKVFLVLGLLILLKHGLPGIAELSRTLSAEEIQQLCNDHRLVTTHLGRGVFLPYPLTSDIRVGHVMLDDIRHYFWQSAAHQNQVGKSQHWSMGPRGWEQMLIKIMEQALAAPMYENATGILSRRPETEGQLTNPWLIARKGELADIGYALLPASVQEQIMTYLTYCHQEQQMEIVTLRSRARELMYFFTWLRRQGKLTSYPDFSQERAQEVFRAYAREACAELQASSRRARFTHLAHFFATMSYLDFPVPLGYRLLYTLEKYDPSYLRSVPREEVMDCIFREGVRHLGYDPLARLALTIQYYCGTRVTETCDLHLFCILEDRDGHAYLLIPKGKSKEERPFPIVDLGMGPLLEYMDEIDTLHLAPDGTPRTLGKTNFRYLHEDPQRALDWHYLFDRVPSAERKGKARGRLSKTRVSEALAEALLIAAKTNADGLFQPETYSGVCQHRRQKGQRCFYFAAKAGITTCPCCGSSLSGKLGTRCRHILEEDFLCDGVALSGEAFCPKCDAPLAEFLPISPHIFRHNSVSRAHRAGVPLAHNMRLHGHKTATMHLRYLHLLLEDTTNEVRQIFAEKRLRDVRQMLGSAPGQIVEGGIAYTVSLEQYLGLTLQRALKRRTYGIWGGFWAGALAQRGIASPLSVEDEIVIPEDTYEHTVAQYWYEALGLAVSEVAFEQVTGGRWHAEVPSFLDQHKIETLVQFHLHHVADSFKSALGQRLMETDIVEQRRFLDDLAEKLRPWWQHLGTIDQLVEMFAPGGGHAFHKQLSPTEPAS